MINRLALLFALLAPISAQAGEIQIAGKTIRLTGSIQQTDVPLFHSIAGALDGAFTVEIATTFGDPDAAMAIGRKIQHKGYATTTKFADCRDICALIWLSGTPHTKADKTGVEVSNAVFQSGGMMDRAAVEAYLQSLGLNSQQIAALFRITPEAKETTEDNGEQITVKANETKTSYLAGYDGEMRDGVPHGKGGWTLSNGDRFTGTFQDGRPHGSGLIVTVEGDRLTVVFDQGQLMGRVKLAGADGVQAEQTVDGKILDTRHEQAPWFSSAPVSSAAATARAQSPQDNGQAIQLKDGSRYVGSVKDGKPDGFGKQTFPDGATFTGMFENGNKNGPGILVTAQGMQIAGLWRNDAFRDGSKVGREIKTELAMDARPEEAIPSSGSMIPIGELVGGLSRNEVRRLQTRLNQLHYKAGVPDGKIGRQTRAAVDAYARDFEMVREDRYAADLIDWIGGEVPETKPGWRNVGDKDCQIYSQIVHAISVINWAGVCLEGYAHGRGILKITHRLNGQPVTYVYKGVVKRGRLTGSGTDRFEGPHPAGGTRYEGTFVNGVREGAGTYSEPGLGRIEGSFEAGKPHGYAVQFDGDGKLLASGEFNAGCLTSGTKELAVLTTRQACGF